MPDLIFADPRLARLYDALDGERTDLGHYVALVEELAGDPSGDLAGCRVLDVGCGTGVLALLLADRGAEVIGVDPARASLDVARSKIGADRVRWVESDAARLPIIEDVDVVVLTGNVAQVFSDDEWGAVLRRAAAVLGTGGHLVLETRDPDRRAWEEWTPEATRHRIEDDVEGVVETWTEVTAVDPPLVSFEHHFRFEDASEAVSTSTLRFRGREEVERSLADAWLDLVEVRDAPDRPGHELVVVARKPVDERDHLDRGWRDLARIDADLDSGRIDQDTWHARVLALIEPAYLSADSAHAQSGKGGDERGWERARRPVCDAIGRDGTFLDVGCANGLLMQDVQRWAAENGHAIEAHGVEIGAGLAALARARCPQWADRIHTANAHGWRPLRRYDVVRTGLDYVPTATRAAYVQHLLDHVVAPGGRLVIGVHNAPEEDPLVAELAEWGHPVDGASRHPHATQEGLFYTVLWVDVAGSAG